MRTALVFVLFLVYLVFLVPALPLCALLGLREPLVSVGRAFARMGRAVLGIKMEISGLDRFDPRAPYIFMPNHASFLDGPLVMLAIPGTARVILKKSILRVPILGQAMRYVGFVPVDRKGAEGGKMSIARAAALIRERAYSFLIFPEGTRSRDGSLQPFRRGGFFLALASGAAIVPVSIRGTFELMPKGQRSARRGRVGIVFHPPVSVAGHTPETMGRLMDEVRGAILSEMGRAT
ncbi:MAG: 1-acyl-sn-glycerol-3-phosphate acyltransferase [Candidatus Aminicenantes bacterium]|nr:1-acyl-sn-glycerol-3-phosphate acyltransferase [Candidatus Aminicenantes bacterium]